MDAFSRVVKRRRMRTYYMSQNAPRMPKLDASSEPGSQQVNKPDWEAKLTKRMRRLHRLAFLMAKTVTAENNMGFLTRII